jgi:SsrA-binding protein
MSGIKVVAQNRKARHYFEFIEFIEAGLVLTGSEVKSLRAGRISFKDGYVQFRSGEAFLIGVHIAHYENAGYAGHDPDQPRKLLLHRREIASLQGKVEQKGLTMVPTRVYLKNGRFKVELALARGKNVRDRRQELKQKAIQRDMDREMAKAK